MIKNNVLEDRLNAYRNGETIPTVQKEDYSQYIKEPENSNYDKSLLIKEIGYELLNLSFVVLKSLAFGYTIQSLFNYDWKFLAILSVGFSIHTLTTGIFNIFTKNKSNEENKES